MDVYDYDENTLATIARFCRFQGYRRSGSRKNPAADISCANCGNWNGIGCSLGRLESIVSEMGI
ncbi:MAG: hypothetical protein ACOX4M_04175 [Acetivibrionales bacterium]|jgi:hypothetical protein